MSIPVIEIPKALKESLNNYRSIFTKPQFKHFTNLVTGLIVSDNKTVQEINDCFGEKDQSSLNRFLTCSDWDKEEIYELMLKQAKRKAGKEGILIIDPTLLHKTGKHMEKANYHYDGLTKEKEWGHLLVNSFFISDGFEFPLRGDIYIRKCDADKNHKFTTTREISISQIEYTIKNNLPLKIVMADAGLYADFLIQKIKSYGKKYVVGIRVTNKISIDREKRISVNDYLNTITDLDFKRFVIDEEVYHLHVKEVYTRGVGKENLIISYKDGDEENIKLYTTNIFNYTDEKLMNLLLKRWKIEELHRDSKQHLGLEDYQVRKFGAIQKVVCAVHVAYTQLALNVNQKILEPLNRQIETIGEGCRFFRLIAVKGMRWLKRKARNIKKLKEILNRFVFVKNAKV